MRCHTHSLDLQLSMLLYLPDSTPCCTEHPAILDTQLNCFQAWSFLDCPEQPCPWRWAPSVPSSCPTTCIYSQLWCSQGELRGNIHVILPQCQANQALICSAALCCCVLSFTMFVLARKADCQCYTCPANFVFSAHSSRVVSLAEAEQYQGD